MCHDSADVLARSMQLHYLSWANLIARCLLRAPSILSPQKPLREKKFLCLIACLLPFFIQPLKTLKKQIFETQSFVLKSVTPPITAPLSLLE